eukprot:376567_1
MFSYCINRVCSDWYRLDHGNFNDFYGSCMSEFFIVPGMTEAIQTAIEGHGSDVALDFEFTTCGSNSRDGLQIDQIGVGHNAALLNIDTFHHATGDDSFCRWSSGDEESFVLDSDVCDKVSVSWNGGTSSIIYDGLISSRCLDEICAVIPGLAQYATGCEVQGLLDAESPIIDYPVDVKPGVYVFEISHNVVWSLCGLMTV